MKTKLDRRELVKLAGNGAVRGRARVTAATGHGASPAQPGQWDLVLHPSHLWLTIHESIGHRTELYRAMGYEANFAGTSLLFPPEKVLNKFRYGPPLMNIVGNRTEPVSLAICK
jgi:TldD protein